MSTSVFLAVLLAAALHASWNALVKGGADRRVNMCGVVIGHLPAAGIALCFVQAPAPESWPWIGAGMVAHLGYQLFLLSAYEKGDLSQVYPIARGAAPLIVTAISTLALGVALSGQQLAAVALIAAGLMSMAAVRGASGARNWPAAKLALVTGCFIASYSLIDGTGARLSGSPVGFYGWLGAANAAIFALWMHWRAPGVLRKTFTTGLPIFFIGGTASFVAYALVIWAFTHAPIALVTALRETSILFALLIGRLAFGEPVGRAKIIAACCVLAGAALLRLSTL